MIMFGIYALANIIIMTKIRKKKKFHKKGKFNSGISCNLIDIYRRLFQPDRRRPMRNVEV